MTVAHGTDQLPRYSAGFQIQYLDEEQDLIVLSTDTDLEEAYRVSAATGGVLRLTLTPERPAPSADKHPRAGKQGRRFRHHQHQHRHQRGAPSSAKGKQEEQEEKQGCAFDFSNVESLMTSLPALLSHLRPMLSSAATSPGARQLLEQFIGSGSVTVETPFACDHCESTIRGDRFHCTTCPDFDLCSDCHAAHGAKHGHKFESVSAVDAILSFLQQGGAPAGFLEAYVSRRGAPVDAVVTHNAICDECNQTIVGVRHRCIGACPDYDVCSSCKSNETYKHEHELYDLKTASAQERALFEKEKLSRACFKPLRVPEPKAEEEPKVDILKKLVPVQEAKVPEAKVEEPPKAEEPKAEPRALNSFERNLVTLESMGFTDRAACIKCLVKHKNVLLSAIQELLA